MKVSLKYLWLKLQTIFQELTVLLSVYDPDLKNSNQI